MSATSSFGQSPQILQLVIVDPSVNDYETLLQGLSADTAVLVLPKSDDNLEWLATQISGFSGLDAIHVLSHGSPGVLHLGGKSLNADNLGQFGALTSALGQAVSEGGDILLYGCNVAASESGVEFVGRLVQITGADVAASEDMTGASDKGGDWQLELQHGRIDAAELVINSFEDTLASISSGGTTSFTEQTATAVAPSISVNDIGGDTGWDGGTLKVQITGNASAADSLRLPTSNPGTGIWVDGIGTNFLYSGATLIGTASASTVTGGAIWIFTFNATATTALVQDVARAVLFGNDSNEPSTASRAITFTATDNGSHTSSATQTVQVVSVNDAPVVNNRNDPGLVFSGVNTSYASFPDIDNSVTDSFSLEAWVKFSSLSDAYAVQFIAGKGAPGSVEQMELHTNGNSLRFIPTGGAYIDTGAVLTTNQWIHIAATYSAATDIAKIYINGAEVAAQDNHPDKVNPDDPLKSTIHPYYLGKRGDGGLPLNGSIAEFRIWNDIRTGDEIRNNMNIDLQGNEANLVSLWKLNENTGASLSDSTANNYHGTAYNTGWTTRPVSGGLAVNYTEGATPVSLFSGATVSTVESGQSIIGLTLTVTNVGDSTERLAIDGSAIDLVHGVSGTTATNSVGYTVSVIGGTATVTLSKAGGVTEVQAAALINGISYSNSSEGPTTANPRVVTLAAMQDDGGGSDTATLALASTVTLVGTNDTPTVTGVPTDVTVAEDIASTFNLSAVTVADVDGDNLTVSLAASAGTFAASTSGGVTVSGSGTGTLTLAGTAANINTWLDTVSNIRYTGVVNANGNNAATFTLKANDGTVDSAVANGNIDITAVNDAPTSTNDTMGTQFGVPKTLTISDFGTYSDLDNDSLAAVKITVLPGTGALKLNGNAVSVNDVITIGTINSGKLVFTPGAASTSIGFQVGDGTGFSAATYTLSVSITDLAASSLTKTTSGSWTNIYTADPVSGFTGDVRIVVEATNGKVKLADATGVTAITQGYGNVSDGTATSIAFEGTQAAVNAAMRQLQASAKGADPVTLNISASKGGSAYNPVNQHCYEYAASPGILWSAAKVAAEGKSFNGLTGYLATITSDSENTFIVSKVGGNAWIGASDQAEEGKWKWVTGPENGTLFFTDINTNDGTTNASPFYSWQSGEPNNDLPGGAHWAQIITANTGALVPGKWNDLPNTGGGGDYAITGYVVEYGGIGSVLEQASRTVSLTVESSGGGATPSPVPSPTIPPQDEWADLPDDDGDGIPELVENFVPSLVGGAQGDGNGDGVMDTLQSDVTSVPFRETDTISQKPDAPMVFVTLAIAEEQGEDGGVSPVLQNVKQLDAPIDLPGTLSMPLGILSFEALVGASGSTEAFSLYVDDGVLVNGYWKQNAVGTWVNLASAAYGGRVVQEKGKTRLDFQITDGGEFDDDGLADGVITDPGGLGFYEGSAVGDVIRFYNQHFQKHFYAMHPEAEISALTADNSGWVNEGVAFKSQESAESIPVYRFYNAALHDHFYTSNANEAFFVQENMNMGYSFEGIEYYASGVDNGNGGIYRLFNSLSGKHFYTSDVVEAEFSIAALGFQMEGMLGYTF